MSMNGKSDCDIVLWHLWLTAEPIELPFKVITVVHPICIVLKGSLNHQGRGNLKQ